MMKKYNEKTEGVYVGYLACIQSEFFYIPVYIIESLIEKAEKKSVNIVELRMLGCSVGKVKTARQKKYRINLQELLVNHKY